MESYPSHLLPQAIFHCLSAPKYTVQPCTHSQPSLLTHTHSNMTAKNITQQEERRFALPDVYALLTRVRQNNAKQRRLNIFFFFLFLRPFSLEKQKKGGKNRKDWLKESSTLTLDDAHKNVLLFPFWSVEVQAADGGGATQKFGLLRGPHKSLLLKPRPVKTTPPALRESEGAHHPILFALRAPTAL